MENTLELETVVTDYDVEQIIQPETVVEIEVVEKIDGRKLNAGRKPKTYNIHTNNTPYLDYLTTLGENTQYQYGLTVKNFLVSLGQKTPKRVTVDELTAFVGDSNVKRVHVRGFYKWLIEGNVSGTADDVQRAVLIWLL